MANRREIVGTDVEGEHTPKRAGDVKHSRANPQRARPARLPPVADGVGHLKISAANPASAPAPYGPTADTHCLAAHLRCREVATGRQYPVRVHLVGAQAPPASESSASPCRLCRTRGLALPRFSGLTEAQVAEVADASADLRDQMGAAAPRYESTLSCERADLRLVCPLTGVRSSGVNLGAYHDPPVSHTENGWASCAAPQGRHLRQSGIRAGGPLRPARGGLAACGAPCDGVDRLVLRRGRDTRGRRAGRSHAGNRH